jgi:hypothetical protein
VGFAELIRPEADFGVGSKAINFGAKVSTAADKPRVSFENMMLFYGTGLTRPSVFEL